MAGSDCSTTVITAPPITSGKTQTVAPMRRQLQRRAGAFWMPPCTSSSPTGIRSWRRAPLRGASEGLRPPGIDSPSSALAISDIVV